MYSMVDLCVMCLTNTKNLKSISSQDSDGVQVEEKLRYFLFELNAMKPEITKYICSQCLENLNHVYNYKKQCLRNIIMLNNYIQTLTIPEGPYKHLQVSLTDIENLKLTQNIPENENSECIKIENIKLEDLTSGNCLENINNENEGGNELLQEENIQKIEIHEEIYVKVEPEDVYDYYNNEEMTIEDESKFEIAKECIKEELTDISDDTNEPKDLLQNEAESNAEYISKDSAVSSVTYSTCEIGKLNIHHRTQSGKNPYYCETCCITFIEVSTYRKHQRVVHMVEKPHACDQCNKSFKRKFALTVHKRSHSGEKPFKCDLCEMEFYDNSRLTRHRKLHANEKPFACDECGRKFNRSCNLVAHKSRMHKNSEGSHSVMNQWELS